MKLSELKFKIGDIVTIKDKPLSLARIVEIEIMEWSGDRWSSQLRASYHLVDMQGNKFDYTYYDSQLELAKETA
jgi:hypothetical protein